MIDYEILLMLDPDLAEERQTEIIARVRTLVESGGGSFDRHDPWGRRKLAYEIAKKADGAYHLLLFSSTPEVLDEIGRVLKIDDGVMRHMATRRSEGGPGEPVAVGAQTSDDRDDHSLVDSEEE